MKTKVLLSLALGLGVVSHAATIYPRTPEGAADRSCTLSGNGNDTVAFP